MWKGGAFERDPWFLHADYQYWREMGLTRSRRRQALRGLIRLYPPAIRNRLRDSPEGWRLLAPLLICVSPGAVVPLLQVGLAVDELGCGCPRNLLERLRSDASFSDAALELRVWANLQRFKALPHRELPGRDGKNADFGVLGPEGLFAIEVKRLHEAQVDRVARAAEKELEPCALLDMATAGSRVTIRGTGELRRLPMSRPGRAKLEGRTEALRGRLSAVVRCPVPRAPSRVSLGDGIEMIVESAPESLGEIVLDLFDESDDERRAGRIVEKVAEAAEQLHDGATGIVLIDTGNRSNPALVVRAMRAALREHRRCEELRRVSLVVLRFYERGDWGPVRWFGLHLPINGYRPSTWTLRLADRISR